MDWVYYHDVLARFTLRHWEGKAVKTSSRTSSPSRSWALPDFLPSLALGEVNFITYDDSNVLTGVCTEKLPNKTCFLTENSTSHPVPSTSALLGLLSEVCDAVSVRPHGKMSTQDLDDYKNFLKILDWKIRSIPVPVKGSEISETATIVELYQTAILVYLNRVSGYLLDYSARTQQQIDRAFNLFSQLNSCERQFPVFILGCEARTDDQRATVLDLISRTEKSVSSRSLNHVKILIQAVWAQDDLADRELDYWDKLSTVIGSCTILPSLV